MSNLVARLSDALGPTYRLDEELGGGGMSRVFLAEETALGRRVVIKVLPPDAGAGVSAERFHREVQLTARLQHPNIVPLLAAGAAGELLYYVMPYVAGESLRERLDRDHQLPVAEAVRILREVCDALAHAHGQGVVHRDIKPDNVLLSGGHALVADFGVARALDSARHTDGGSSTDSHALTAVGVALGTPAYMAPEQAAGEARIDHRADVYAVGALAYEMLAGRPPFQERSAQALIAAHLTRQPEPLSFHRPTVPAALDALVMQCLQKLPADRPQQATELVARLDELAVARPATAVTTSTPDAPRGTPPALVAMWFTLAAVAVLALAWWLTDRMGLPSWVVPSVGILLAAGVPVLLLTTRRERARLIARATGEHVATPAGFPDRLLSWRGAIGGGGLALGGLALVTALFMTLRAAGVGPFATLVSAGVLNERDPIVLADFANRTGDATLGASITEAIRVDLAQTGIIRLVETNAVTAALRRMQRSPADSLTASLARDVAEREGAKAVVTGEVAALGSGYSISASVLSVSDTATLLTHRETARNAAEIITAVERLSRWLREHIGESLRTVRASPALEQVTTQSLPALRAYSRGTRAQAEGRPLDAVRYLREAIALDTNFAMAWRRLGTVLNAGRGQLSEVTQSLTKAYDLRQNLPPREAAHAEALYYGTVLGDRPRQIAAYEALLDRWPADHAAANNLALYYMADGRYGDAEELLRQAAVLQASNAVIAANLVLVLVRQRKLDTADSVMAAWRQRQPGSLALAAQAAGVARLRGRIDQALAYADTLLAAPGRDAQATGFIVRIETLRTIGRLREASETAERYLAFLEQNNLLSTWYAEVLWEAWIDIQMRDRPTAALRRIDAALARHPLDSEPPEVRPYGQLAFVLAQAEVPQRAAAVLREATQQLGPDGTEADPWYHGGLGMLRVVEGDPRTGLRHLRRASDMLSCSVCTLLFEARALEAMASVDSARALYHVLADHPLPRGEGYEFQIAATLRRLGELYDAQNDRANALEYYGRFVDLWANADPELQPVVRQVRARMATLAGEPPGGQR